MKENNGITLVTLTITIIIIILLSTVVINFTFGDNGLITRTEVAKELTENSMEYETEAMSNLLMYLNNTFGDIAEPGDSDEDNPANPDIPNGWDTDKVKVVESTDSVKVPVPIGYTESGLEEEMSVMGGFVIYEGTEEVNNSNIEEAKRTRNQFVWIPVDNINELVNEMSGVDNNGRKNYQGKLYDCNIASFSEKENYGIGLEDLNYREPDVVTLLGNYDENPAYVKDILELENSSELKIQLQEEFNKMVESVETYGGFYIARYETGNNISQKNIEPVVVKGNSTISNVNWYYEYFNSKLVASNDNVVSTVIWGCMWDRTLIWLTETYEQSSGIYGKSNQNIYDSSNWGNYNNNNTEGSGEVRETGYSENWKANNIYDLAGNVAERTMEANLANSRVIRGGIYYNSGASDSVSKRIDDVHPDNNNYDYGSRIVLYIK